MVQADSLSAVDPVSSKIRDLIAGMAEALVDHPERVSVEALAEPTSTVLRLRVDPTDIGKIIGKQGRTARSMRTILSAASMKLHHRFSLDIVEESAGPTQASAPPAQESALPAQD